MAKLSSSLSSRVSIPKDLETLRTIAEISARASGAKKVILFGSVARGEAHADSDLDLLLVMADNEFGKTLFEQIEATRKASEALFDAGYRMPMDLLPMRFGDYLTGRSIIARVAQREGIVLFESRDAGTEVVHG
jgi:uncharacterized protein